MTTLGQVFIVVSVLFEGARSFALTNDQEGDDRLIRELTEATYDGVVIGGYINGQDPEVPPTEQTTQWFNRILDIIHTHAQLQSSSLGIRLTPEQQLSVCWETRFKNPQSLRRNGRDPYVSLRPGRRPLSPRSGGSG